MKIFRRIVAVLLVFTIICGNAISTYSKDVEYNKTVIVGETIQLKIPAGADKINWETSSKRIATVSKKGELTGVKEGNCDIHCEAVYPKFLIFKDTVNYTFHITVISSSSAHNSINMSSNNEITYQTADMSNAYYLPNVTTNFTFDINVDNINNSYTITNIYGNGFETEVKNQDGGTYTIGPKETYETRTTYIVALNDGTEFCSEEYKEYRKLIFKTDGEDKCEVEYSDKVVNQICVVKNDDLLSVNGDNADSNPTYKINSSSLNVYNKDSVIIVQDDDGKYMPYRIIDTSASGVTVEVANAEDVFSNLDIYYNGPLNIKKDLIMNDKELLKKLEDTFNNVFCEKVYAATVDDYDIR